MKRALSLFLTVAILACMLPCFALPVAADSLYIRKIVSVVYDDSGSMRGDKWAYANYAMQAFCGMLNSEDQLYISYMSEAEGNYRYEPSRVDLSSDGIQSSVNAIRGHSDYGNTPYSAVQAAYKKLQGVQDSNPNTQYWLVVITDGGFTDKGYNDLGLPNWGQMDSKKELNEEFNKYVDSTMPNGTHPQVTFLGIGNVLAPDENTGKGIYTYSADGANDIIDTMSRMADRISGRTRLDSSALVQVDDTTIQVSSTIPLLNVAVFSQRSEAKVVGATYGNEAAIPVSRQASLSYPKYADLVGSACLLGDSQKVIGAGTYSVTFDRPVKAKDVIVLLEPALEMRMIVSVNGTPIADYSELRNTMEGDTISVSCKIYEMGTDNEIDPSLLPPGTKYEILVTEDGKEVVRQEGKDMQLAEYVLKNTDTALVTRVTIDGFKPIEYYETFTPTQYVPKVVYTMDAAFADGVKSVRLDDIAANRDMAVEFTVYADGVPITDPQAVQALVPTVVASPSGNTGTVSYSADGKIVYTPNGAPQVGVGVDHFDVEVTCTLENGVTANATYTVLVALYEVIPLGASGTITKTEFYGNTVGASYYITKDGTRLTQADVEAHATAVLNDAYAHLDTRVEVAADGTITLTPHDPTERRLTFGRWLVNWAWYWGLPREDVTVTLSHAYGSASTAIGVVPPTVSYLIWNVWVPFILEMLILAFLVWWVYAICAKPRFSKTAALYIGNLDYFRSDSGAYHEVYDFKEYPLDCYNKLRYYLSPTLNNRVHHVAKGVYVSAGDGGAIKCHCRVWFTGFLEPRKRTVRQYDHPMDVVEHVAEYDGFQIKVVSPTTDAESIRAFTNIPTPLADTYYVSTTQTDLSAIENGTVFAYAYKR